MIPATAIISFIAILLAIGSLPKTIFFFRMIKKGLINPSHSDLTRINSMLKDKKHHPFFAFVFKKVLIFQVKILLRKAVGKEKFINCVNFILSRTNRYYFRNEIKLKIGEVLDKYDLIIQKKIYSYESHKAWPVVQLMHNISKIRKYNPNLLCVSFNAGQDALIKLVGEPLVENKFDQFVLDKRVVKKILNLFNLREQIFINNLSKIKFAA